MFDAFIIGAWFLFVNALQSFFLSIVKYNLLKKRNRFSSKINIWYFIYERIIIFRFLEY
jgi:hypothetical protein